MNGEKQRKDNPHTGEDTPEVQKNTADKLTILTMVPASQSDSTEIILKVTRDRNSFVIRYFYFVGFFP